MKLCALLSLLLALSCGSSFEGSSVSTVEDASGPSEPKLANVDAREASPISEDGAASTVPDASSTVDAPSSPPPSCPDVWERECMPDAAVVACAGRCGLCPRLGVQVCLAK
jgi:hypothetical protein